MGTVYQREQYHCGCILTVGSHGLRYVSKSCGKVGSYCNLWSGFPKDIPVYPKKTWTVRHRTVIPPKGREHGDSEGCKDEITLQISNPHPSKMSSQ